MRMCMKPRTGSSAVQMTRCTGTAPLKEKALTGVGLLHGDGQVLLLRGQDTSAAAAGQAVLEHLVGHNVQLLLVLTL